MARQHPLVAVEPDTLPDLRAATREAHEALQELRAVIAAAEATRDEIAEIVRRHRTEIDEVLAEHAREAMRGLGDELRAGRDRSLEKIRESMDDYWRLMVGEARSQRGEGETTGELIRRRVIAPLDDLRGRVAALERRQATGGTTP